MATKYGRCQTAPVAYLCTSSVALNLEEDPAGFLILTILIEHGVLWGVGKQLWSWFPRPAYEPVGTTEDMEGQEEDTDVAQERQRIQNGVDHNLQYSSEDT